MEASTPTPSSVCKLQVATRILRDAIEKSKNYQSAAQVQEWVLFGGKLHFNLYINTYFPLCAPEQRFSLFPLADCSQRSWQPPPSGEPGCGPQQPYPSLKEASPRRFQNPVQIGLWNLSACVLLKEERNDLTRGKHGQLWHAITETRAILKANLRCCVTKEPSESETGRCTAY